MNIKNNQCMRDMECILGHDMPPCILSNFFCSPHVPLQIDLLLLRSRNLKGLRNICTYIRPRVETRLWWDKFLLRYVVYLELLLETPPFIFMSKRKKLIAGRSLLALEATIVTLRSICTIHDV